MNRGESDKGSISPTFYEQLLRQYSSAKKYKRKIVSTKELCAKLSYESQTSSFSVLKFRLNFFGERKSA
jgi:hypothetical protein